MAASRWPCAWRLLLLRWSKKSAREGFLAEWTSSWTETGQILGGVAARASPRRLGLAHKTPDSAYVRQNESVGEVEVEPTWVTARYFPETLCACAPFFLPGPRVHSLEKCQLGQPSLGHRVRTPVGERRLSLPSIELLQRKVGLSGASSRQRLTLDKDQQSRLLSYRTYTLALLIPSFPRRQPTTHDPSDWRFRIRASSIRVPRRMATSPASVHKKRSKRQ